MMHMQGRGTESSGTSDGRSGMQEILERAVAGTGGELYCPVQEEEFLHLVPLLAGNGFILTGLFAVEEFESRPGISLLTVFEKDGTSLVLVRKAGPETASIARTFPSACWFERECTDGFGIEFRDAFDMRRLFLHEPYPADFHPLIKSVPNKPVPMKEKIAPEDEYPFRTVEGDGIYQIPVGPVHAGIIEPGHFRFSVIGETIFNLEIRMFYKHRGIEKLAEGKRPEECLKIAEAVSGDESAANAVAFALAVERIAGIAVPERGWFLRTIFLEMERICSLLGDLSGMLVDVAFPLGASQFAVLREECFRMNRELTGSRFLRGAICIGGVTKDIPETDLLRLTEFTREIRKQFRIGLHIVLSTTSVIDRFATTGIVRPDLILPLALSGPVARASGRKVDVRIDTPYGIYDRYRPEVAVLHDGDVLSRFTVKAAEIQASLGLIERLAADIMEGPVRAGATDGASLLSVRDGHSLAIVESARGRNLCWVCIRNGAIWRYKVVTASFCNWQAIEHAVPGNIVADFPVINKSLNLSYAGTDL